MKAKTTNQFIIEAKLIHSNKFTYENTIYKNNKTKVLITCLKHGDFEQLPVSHLIGKGCKKCVDEKQTGSLENFIINANRIHNNFYNYESSIYINSSSLINISCPKHGLFSMIAGNHIQGKGCSQCNKSKGELSIFNYLTNNNIKFIQQFKIINCKNINPLPFDFYIPSFNLLIEYQGKQHFIETNYYKMISLNERQRLDKIKKDYALNNGFKFLEITYKDHIINKLKNFLK
jgi:very-short-patch-repair endonuclease